jgi:transketolase
LYATLIALGKLPFSLIHTLRRYKGLPGHPDVEIPYIATNTGSLGMGISKAHGMVRAKRLKREKGNVYVLTGDGELQEGQFWESLQPAANDACGEITVIVDHNKIQSDTLVSETSDLGNIEGKLRAFGWEVARIDGHDLSALKSTLRAMRQITDRPKIIIADTVKGKGVSFMEKIDPDGYYRYHSGAPAIPQYLQAAEELLQGLNALLGKAGAKPATVTTVEIPARVPAHAPQRLIAAYTEELLALAKKHKSIVAMDGDLVLDTGLIPFKAKYPERYIEAGIAEQDMVSQAGGLALRGMLPIVHSFACFLPTRANEHFYNNASERTKIIYTASLAGLLPGGPGHSHQSVRDISIVGSIPGLTLIEPSNEEETKMALRWAVEKNSDSTYLRLVSIPVEMPFTLPKGHMLSRGKGTTILSGKDAMIVTYGPTMLSEGYRAAMMLKKEGFSIGLTALPWLNTVDDGWLHRIASKTGLIIAIDDHYRKLGQSAMLAQSLVRKKGNPPLVSVGIEDIPACGTNIEVLAHHKLDAVSLAATIRTAVRKSKKQ